MFGWTSCDAHDGASALMGGLGGSYLVVRVTNGRLHNHVLARLPKRCRR